MHFSKQAFVHKTTGEVISFPDPDSSDFSDMELFEEVFGEDYQKWEENADDYYHIQAMDSHEAFRVMEDFADQVKDQMYRGVLLRILERHKPFRNFKDEVEGGHERDAWFAYQEKRELEHIREQLEMEMQSDEEED